MNDINLKQIIEQFPDCVTNGAKLKAILLDTYPEISKAIVNTLVIMVNSGIAKKIQDSENITELDKSRWYVKIEDDFGLSEKFIELGLNVWIKAIDDLRYSDFHISKHKLLKYTGASHFIVVPNKIHHIGNEAFKNCEKIKSIIISEGVKDIGDYAFENCFNLENISLPQSLEKVGYNAFCHCSKLKTTILDNIMYVGNSNNPYLVALKGKDEVLTQCSMPQSTKIIYSNAFMDCVKLKRIKLPQLNSIGISAFAGCAELETVNAKKCDEINEYAFSYCEKLKIISIGGNIKSIKKYAFEGCRSLKEFRISRLLMVDKDIFGEYSSNNEEIDICYDFYCPFHYNYRGNFRYLYEHYIKHDIFVDYSDFSYSKYDIEDEWDLWRNYGRPSYSYYIK